MSMSHSLLVIWHLPLILLTEWRDGKRIWLVESCEKLHTADISHESNIFVGSLTCKSKGRESNLLPSVNGMLSLFAEEANSPSILCHCFDVIKSPVQHTNPGQIPVICVNQPRSVCKVETTTMAHAQSVWRRQICYPSWWTADGDDLLQSPGPMGWKGWKWMG